jgi:hypothetical protein
MLEPHAEEARSAVSKYEVAPPQHDQSRSKSLIEVFERVRSSTRFTITAQ